MAWNSAVIDKQNADDQGAFVHVLNENTAWHGHTVLVIEYPNRTFWGLSFQPATDTNTQFQNLFGSGARIVNRTAYGSTDWGVGAISDKSYSHAITQAQVTALHQKIAAEQQLLNQGTLTYALVGIPVIGMFQTGYRDTCYSWAVRVLREAGIISSAWVLTRWLSFAPKTSDLFGEPRRQSGDAV